MMQKAVTLPKDILTFIEAVPDLYLVLSTDFTILAASKPMLEVIGCKLEDIHGKNLFDVFPDNPALPNSDGTANLRSSLEWVLQQKQPHQMGLQRYDVQIPSGSGSFRKKYWVPTNIPVLDEAGNIQYILQKVVDISEHIIAKKQLEQNGKQDELRFDPQQASKYELNGDHQEMDLRLAQTVQELNQKLEQRVAERTLELQAGRVEMEAQRNRLKKLFMEAPAPICILRGEEFIFELVNPAYQKLLPGRKLLGNSIIGIALAELANHPLADLLRHVYQTGETAERKEELVPVARYEGGPLEDRYFNYILQARRDEKGMVDGIIIFVFEVTDQVNDRHAVERSAEQLQLITDALPVLIGYLDTEEKYQFANKAYESWFPIKSSDLLGRAVREIVGEKAYQGVKKYINLALAGERIEFESRMPYRKDFVKHIRTSYVPDIREGKVLGFFTLVMDETEHVASREKIEKSEKEAQALTRELAATNEELIASNEQLVRTNIDLDNFIYTASHDLKAPINNIEGLVNILMGSISQETGFSPEIEHVKQMIEDSIERFKNTIGHLTEIIKLQKENNQEAEVVDIPQVIHDVTLDLAPQLEEGGVQLKVNVAECPVIYFSHKNLRSIIYNLLSNAIKYNSPERTPEIQIACSQEGDDVVLQVRDNGLGMHKDGRQKLFTMFGRLHDHVEGTGIGLYMVKKIVENAGGRIEVESEVGVGSTFSIYLKSKV